VSGLQGLSQDYVTSHYQGQQQASPGWGSASNVFFNVVLGGFQTIADFLAQLVHSITGGVASGFTALQDFFVARAGEVLDLFGHVQSIADNIFNAAFGLVTSGNPLTAVFDAIGALLGFSKTAQGSADVANTGVAILNARVDGLIAGGTSIYDTFGRTGPDFGPDWDMVYGPGSGSAQTDGGRDGVATWVEAGATARTMTARHLTPMATNRNRISFVADQPYSPAGQWPVLGLCGRMGPDGTTRMQATINANSAEIGWWVGGTYNRLGSPASLPGGGVGDLYDFNCGIPGDEWRFQLLRNNSVILDRTDLGHVTPKDITPGTNYKYTGVVMQSGVEVFFATFQYPCPDIQVFAAVDY
jgi:hypothetical protein